MHFVNPSVSERYKNMSRVATILFWSALICLAAWFTVTGESLRLLDQTSSVLVQQDWVSENSPLFSSFSAPYVASMFYAMVALMPLLIVYRYFSSSARYQSELDKRYYHLRRCVNTLLSISSTERASMKTLYWEISVSRQERFGSSVVCIDVTVVKRTLETWPLRGTSVLMMDARGMSAVSGYMSNLRLLAVSRLLGYVLDYHKDRQ